MPQLRDIVKTILEVIKDVAKKPDEFIIDEDPYPKNNLIFLESQLSYFELTQLLIKLSELIKFSKLNIEATPENIKPLCDFLKTRWERIKDTDAIYTHNYKSRMTRICIRLAEALSKVTQEPVLKILMPTLKMQDPVNINDFKKLIMDDHNTRVIDVTRCLEETHKMVLQNEEPRFLHTHAINDVKGPLTETEITRLKRYSENAQIYYNDIIAKKKGTLDEDKNNLTQTLGTLTFSNYEDKGWQKLRKGLYGDIQNREQLIDTLLKFQRMDWEKYLNNFDPEKLRKLVLDEKVWVKVLQEKRTYNGNEEHDRAALFLLLYIYRKKREACPDEYTGWFGGWTGFSRREILDGSFIIYNFLCSESKDAKVGNIDHFLKKEGKDEYKDEYKKFAKLFSLQWGSNVGKFIRQMIYIRSPEFLKELQEEKKLEDRAGYRLRVGI